MLEKKKHPSQQLVSLSTLATAAGQQVTPCHLFSSILHEFGYVRETVLRTLNSLDKDAFYEKDFVLYLLFPYRV